MSTSTTLLLVVAAILLTATPGEAHPFRFPIPGRYRGRGGWLRGRYSAPATPTTPSQRQCTCAPSAPAATGTGGAGSRSAAAADVPDRWRVDCVAPLAGMMTTCYEFLTGSSSSSADDAPAPGSDCCAGLAGFVDRATAVGGGGDSTLECLCPVLRGEANPLDPLRMIYLPVACRVGVPPLVPLCLNASSPP